MHLLLPPPLASHLLAVIAVLLAAVGCSPGKSDSGGSARGAATGGTADPTPPEPAEEAEEPTSSGGVRGWEHCGNGIIMPGRGPDTHDWPDADNDGLSDLAEARLGTDPFHPDSDRDCLGDAYELQIELLHPLCFDTDGDGVDDMTELYSGADPLDESDPYYTPYPQPDCLPSLIIELYDLDADPDGDGLPSRLDAWQGGDPLSADGDGDGLDDPDELEYWCNPLAPDTDDDGLDDGDELAWVVRCDRPDSDGDGLLDGEERDNRCSPRDADSDLDGLTDLEEIKDHGTWCDDADTDDDLLDDADELELGSDPLDARSRADVDVPNEVRYCREARTVMAYNFGDPAAYAGRDRPTPEGVRGPECECTFELVGRAPRGIHDFVVGASLDIHAGTPWAADPLPFDVLFSAPSWGMEGTTAGTDLRFIRAQDSETPWLREDRWTAFGHPFVWEQPYHDYTRRDISGPMTVRVSYANATGAPIGDDCSVLEAVIEPDGTVTREGLWVYVYATGPIERYPSDAVAP